MAQYRLCVKKKEHNLLLYSNVTKDYPQIYELLITKDRITENDIKPHHINIKNFFQYSLNKVVQQATNEWIGNENHPVDDMENNRIPCALCGTNTRYVFYIYNKLNGKHINVGSECVKHFGINVSRQGKTADQLIKEAIRVKCLNKLNDKFPGIDKLINNWPYELENYSIVIPLILEKPFLELGEKAKFLLEEYLEQNDDKDYFKEFSELLNGREKLIKEIEEYVQKNKNKKFIPTREIEIWLKTREQYEALKWIKEDGKIIWRTAHRIEEPNFMNLLAKEFNKKLNPIGIEIEKVDEDRKCYVFTPLSDRNIRLYNRHKDFVLNYGGLLFGEDPIESFDFQTLINRFKVYYENSVNTIVRGLHDVTKNSKFRFWALHFKFDEVVINEKSSNKYFVACLSDIVDKFKGLILNTKDVNIYSLLNYIDKLPNKSYNKEDFLELYERYKDNSTRL